MAKNERDMLNRHNVFIIFAFAALNSPVNYAQDQHCNDWVSVINVTSSGGVLYSPGYPENYHNSERCRWLLTSRVAGKVLQLQPLSMDVGLEKSQDGDCGDDVIAHDGGDESQRVLRKWCGHDMSVVHSTGSNIFLEFRANDRQRHRGFAIKYSLITNPVDICSEKGQTIPVDNVPIVIEITPVAKKTLLSVCSLRVVADDVTRHIVMDLETYPSGLDCRLGNFSVFDGPEMSSPEVLKWCSRSTQPFGSLFLSGNQGFVLIRTKVNISSPFRFTFYTRPSVFPCNSTLLPELEIKSDLPVLVSLPFASNANGTSCPLRVLTTERHGVIARLDLLQSGGKVATCSTRSVHVFQVDKRQNSVRVNTSCWREERPVFWIPGNSFVVTLSKESSSALVRIIPNNSLECQGSVVRHVAPTDEVLAIKHPATDRQLQYPNNAWCMYGIWGHNDADRVLVRVSGELCERAENCGDYIRIYDGLSTDNRLLYDSGRDKRLNAHVISSGHHILYELNTDDKDNFGFIHAEFNSVPDGDLCEEGTIIRATTKSKNLSSVNYPHYYPVNYKCQYCIEPETINDTLVLDVLHADLAYTCTDSVEVYTESENGEDQDYIGRFCSQEMPSFTTSGSRLCLLFRSDSSIHGQGWLVSYRAVSPLTVDGSQTLMPTEDCSLPIVILGVALAATILLLLIFIMVYIIKVKRKNEQ